MGSGFGGSHGSGKKLLKQGLASGYTPLLCGDAVS